VDISAAELKVARCTHQEHLSGRLVPAYDRRYVLSHPIRCCISPARVNNHSALQPDTSAEQRGLWLNMYCFVRTRHWLRRTQHSRALQNEGLTLSFSQQDLLGERAFRLRGRLRACFEA